MSDTTLYNVNVQFNLEVESQNVKTETKQTLAFSVNYVGAVVSSMEVPDEDNGTVSFKISAEGGSGQGTSASPYVVTAGNALNLTIGQTSTYTDADWSEYTCSPRANISVYADNDRVYAESLDQLTSLIGDGNATNDVDGENPKVYTIGQVFTVGGQSIHFDMDYEVYPYTTQAGQEIEMPYLRVNQASYQGAQTNGAAAQYAVKSSRAVVTAVPQTRATVNDTTWYDVNVKFNVELEGVNTAEPTSQELVFSVNYTGGVITQTEVDEPDLVRVEYRTDYVWEEAHDNLPLLYYATVYRDRYYSNGDVITDTFRDSGHMVSLSPVRDPSSALHINELGVEKVFSDLTREANDSISIVYASVQIAADPTTVFAEDVYNSEDNAGNWGNYVVSKLYDDPNLYIPADGVPSNGNWASDSRADGWYFSDCRFSKMCNVSFKGEYEGFMTDHNLGSYTITIAVYDQFLVIDGRRIDFLAYRPEYHFNMLTDNIDNGVRQTYECKFNFMGRNFYVAVINDITSL